MWKLLAQFGPLVCTTAVPGSEMLIAGDGGGIGETLPPEEGRQAL